jgi:hypothetical protein
MPFSALEDANVPKGLNGQERNADPLDKTTARDMVGLIEEWETTIVA